VAYLILVRCGGAALKIYFLIQWLRPVSVVFLLISGFVAARAPRSLGFVLLSVACFVSAYIVAAYFLLTLQIEWKVTLLPAAARRAIFIVDGLLEPVERFIWPAAVIILVRERRASGRSNI
jgi:hypothetical protein